MLGIPSQATLTYHDLKELSIAEYRVNRADCDDYETTTTNGEIFGSLRIAGAKAAPILQP